MNKIQFLKSLTTPQLIAWKDRAESVSGVYTYFDSEKNSSINFKLESICAELDRRDDNPNRIAKKKKK